MKNKQTQDFLEDVGKISAALTRLGWHPVLIGGMALVVLGSRRVTRDFDFVIAKPDEQTDELVELFYSQGFELVSQLDTQGDIVSTISNRRVAKARLDLDSPPAAYFYNIKIGLRIDLLFDFPMLAKKLIIKAKKIKIASHSIHIASKEDLLELKKIAKKARHKPGDEEDILFLENLIKN